MKQQFNEDRAELEAHFAERLQGYIELGETPEQARISAREKFGETEIVIRKLRRQRVLRSPILRAIVYATAYMLITALCKRYSVNLSIWASSILAVVYGLYIGKGPRAKRCR